MTVSKGGFVGSEPFQEPQGRSRSVRGGFRRFMGVPYGFLLGMCSRCFQGVPGGFEDVPWSFR